MVVFPVVTPGEDLTVSASGYLDYLRCPERSNGRYRGVFTPATVGGFTGQLAHRMFARRLKSGPIPDRDFAAACRQEIGQGLNTSMNEAGLARLSALQPVIAQVQALMARFERLGDEGFVDAEIDVEAQPAPGVTLRGRIDALFGPGCRLVDWKTGAGLGDAEEQLGFYALVWALQRGDLPDGVEAVSVTSGERFALRPTVADVEATAARVGEMVDTLRRGWAGETEPARTAGPWCRHCPLVDECPEGAAAAALTTHRR